MKLAKILWSVGSLLVNVTIVIYITLSSKAPIDVMERFEYINEHWSIYSGHWKAEFFIMAMITIGAIYFATKMKKVSWSIISVGQIILLTTYPIMLGGYQNTPLEVAEMANQIATVVFVFGNLVFMSGLFHLYLNDQFLRKWLRYTAIILSGFSAIIFLITFLEIINWSQAIVFGPAFSVLYLINAYYGLKIRLE